MCVNKASYLLIKCNFTRVLLQITTLSTSWTTSPGTFVRPDMSFACCQGYKADTVVPRYQGLLTLLYRAARWNPRTICTTNWNKPSNPTGFVNGRHTPAWHPLAKQKLRQVKDSLIFLFLIFRDAPLCLTSQRHQLLPLPLPACQDCPDFLGCGALPSIFQWQQRNNSRPEGFLTRSDERQSQSFPLLAVPAANSAQFSANRAVASFGADSHELGPSVA